MSDSFLSRWSKRKLEARTNQQLEEKAASSPDSKPLLDREISVDQKIAVNSVDDAPPKGQTVSEPDLPLPTEADLVAVEQGGDIKAFMVEKVSTEHRPYDPHYECSPEPPQYFFPENEIYKHSTAKFFIVILRYHCMRTF